MSDSFATPWTVTCQTLVSVGFPRQEYWSGLPSPSPGDLPNLAIEPVSPPLAGVFFTTQLPGKSIHVCVYIYGDIYFYIHVIYIQILATYNFYLLYFIIIKENYKREKSSYLKNVENIQYPLVL